MFILLVVAGTDLFCLLMDFLQLDFVEGFLMLVVDDDVEDFIGPTRLLNTYDPLPSTRTR